MDVLGASILGFFAKTRGCKYQDTELEFSNREDAQLYGRAPRSDTYRPDEQTGLHISEPHLGKTDRMAWGSYTEQAPPVLPANTCVPGFENELLLLARRNNEELNEDDSSNGVSEENEFSSSQDDGHDDIRQEEGSRQDAPTRRTRDSNSHRLFSILSAKLNSLPTISVWSHSANANPSQLFGSTICSATTTLRTSTRHINNAITPRTNSTTSRMAPKTHIWVSLWFLLTAPVIFWDAAYCFMRPRSFTGGDLHWIWEPYGLYQEVDYVYGVEAHSRGDGFANAQSFLNVIETLFNLYYVYAQHVLASPTAPIFGFAAAVMTLSKTVLYWAQEYFCGGCSVGHNDWNTLFWLWIVPNGLWLIVPTLIIVRLYRDMASGLTIANKVNAAKRD